jgi:nucleotide-binding universal stress UspA family protein
VLDAMDIIRKFSKILVGIDGSEYSMNAADHAISLTRAYGSELIALNVNTSDVDITASADSP